MPAIMSSGDRLSARHIRGSVVEQHSGFQSQDPFSGAARALSKEPADGASSSWLIEAIVGTILLAFAIGMLQCAVNRLRKCRPGTHGPVTAANPGGAAEDDAPKAYRLSEAERLAALEAIYAGHCRRATDLSVQYKPAAELDAETENASSVPEAVRIVYIRTEKRNLDNTEETKSSAANSSYYGFEQRLGGYENPEAYEIEGSGNILSLDPEGASSTSSGCPSNMTKQKGQTIESQRTAAGSLRACDFEDHRENHMDGRESKAMDASDHGSSTWMMTHRQANHSQRLSSTENTNTSRQSASDDCEGTGEVIGAASASLEKEAAQKLLASLGSEYAYDDQSCTSEGVVCPICLCDYHSEDILITSKHCAHVFHKDCVLQWLQKHDECPVCRTSMVTELEMNQAATSLMGKARMCRAVASKHSRAAPRSPSPAPIDRTPPAVREAIAARTGGSGRRSLSLVPQLLY